MAGIACAVRGVTFTVPAGGRERRTILDIETLDLSPGKVTVLSGPSGSGKSTLLYLLAGLLVADAGAVSWGDVALGALSESGRDRWRRQNAGFIFQDFHLIDELSPIANVLAPAWFSRFAAGSLKARAAALLERFGVPGDARSVSTLSRGEQQRVALARALLFEPRVIFADEPTASLDARSGELVADALRALAADEGRTLVLASHDPAMLERADEIVRIDHGRLATATPEMTAA